MSTFRNRMEVLVDEIRSSTEARLAGLEHLRSQTHEDLDRSRKQRLERAQESLEHLRRRLEEIRETGGTLRRATRAALGDIASDVCAARRLWAGGAEAREFSGLATTTVVEQPLPPEPTLQPAPGPVVEAAVQPPPAEPEAGRAVEREQLLRLVKAHPEGIRLVDIGNELGVDWRGLIAFTKSLLDEGEIEKIGNLYYVVEETGD